jgi:hypothetical protein
MKMERVAEVVRGWPYDGSLDLNEPITDGAVLNNGDWVEKQADGTVDAAAGATAFAGLVMVGNGDSGSAAASGKAVVLWGNFIADISNYDSTASFAPGNAVTVKAGIITKAVVGTDPVIGFVLDVVAASTTETARIRVKVA